MSSINIPSGSSSVRPFICPSVRHSFPHFSSTCFEILSPNFVQHFILMHVRSSSNAINFRQFVLQLCPFWISNSYKYAVFRTFFLHALINWDEIMHIILFYCITDQVRVSSINIPSGSPSVRPSVRPFVTVFRTFLLHALRYWAQILCNFILMHVRSSSNAINFRQFVLQLCPFWTSKSYKYAVFRTFLLHALIYWDELLHMTLFYCTTDNVRLSLICVNFCWSYAPFWT